MLRFFCTCGHSRGKHENPTTFRFLVAGCDSCNCNKFKSDNKKNKHVEKRFYSITRRIIFVPFAFTLLFFFISEIYISKVFAEKYLEISLLVYFMAFLLVTVYYAVWLPLNKFQNKILSR